MMMMAMSRSAMSITIGVSASDADVVESSVVANGDLSESVDVVVADPVVGFGVGAGSGFG